VSELKHVYTYSRVFRDRYEVIHVYAPELPQMKGVVINGAQVWDTALSPDEIVARYEKLTNSGGLSRGVDEQA
jgi:hypothetical protein